MQSSHFIVLGLTYLYIFLFFRNEYKQKTIDKKYKKFEKWPIV